MAGLQPVRGTHDLLGDDMRRHRKVAETARAITARYCFEEIATPIFEFSEVFKRTLGDTSDIVTKEMYSFTDRGGEEITLRPEGTAGVCRALISGGLAQRLPMKLFYYGPMFRYERPQKGRLRQFHQIGIENMGVAEPLADVETIALGADILRGLGVLDKTILEINTLGDAASRNGYRTALVDYFQGHVGSLSADSRLRLERNPLRILDSKDEGDRTLVAAAPLFTDFLNPESKDFFAQVTTGLERLGIAFTVNPRLVRGLDYYCHTAFEFTTDALGAQSAVLAGGRYDGLVTMMGGPAVPAIGWAGGVERLAMLLAETPAAPRPVAIIPIGPEAEAAASPLAARLRMAGFVVELGYRGNVGKRMKAANKVNARIALLMGEDEMKRQGVTFRDLDTGEQSEVLLSDLNDRLAQFR